jgi:hypothetical protein
MDKSSLCKQIRDCGNADRRWFKQVMPIRAWQDPAILRLWEQSSSISGTPPMIKAFIGNQSDGDSVAEGQRGARGQVQYEYA